MRNLEFKSELSDPVLARQIAQRIYATFIAKLRQTDTYYNVARGRLKKREAVAIDRAIASPEPVEYIFYERPNEISPKVSNYSIFSPAEVQQRYGTAPLNELIVVNKTREIYLLQSARIHIDEVYNLGWFFEFEIVIDEHDESEEVMERAQAFADSLRSTFAPALAEPIQSSYSDLLLQQENLSAK